MVDLHLSYFRTTLIKTSLISSWKNNSMPQEIVGKFCVRKKEVKKFEWPT